MNYFSARQRQDERWDYTCMHGQIYPVGYCRPWRDWTDEELARIGWSRDHPGLVRDRDFAHKHHGDGHTTSEEACECYKEYLLDHDLHLMKEDGDTQRRCEVCGRWTQLYAVLKMHVWYLCEEHNSREAVEKLFPTPGEIWSS